MPRQKRTPKSFQAVTHPERFTPFPHVSNHDDFDELWKTKRPWVLSNMSHTAYHPPQTVRSLMKKFGAEETRVYDVDGAQAFLAVWPKKAVLAFRGTQPREKQRLSKIIPKALEQFVERVLNIDLPEEYMSFLGNDVLADLMFKLRDLGDAAVHKGFLKESNKLWRKLILPDLKTLIQPRNIPVSVTGHSLGGATTIAGMRERFQEVVTFGEPRVGRDISAEFKSKKHTRYVNGDDPVPKVPPRWWPFSFEHHGTPKKVVDPDGPNAIYDHSIIFYSENLS